jgi:hypothetical protein
MAIVEGAMASRVITVHDEGENLALNENQTIMCFACSMINVLKNKNLQMFQCQINFSPLF